jgi:hypothetical protein
MFIKDEMKTSGKRRLYTYIYTQNFLSNEYEFEYYIHTQTQTLIQYSKFF